MLTERLSVSHMDDVINMLMFTSGIYGVTRDDRSRHKERRIMLLAQIIRRDVILSGSLLIVLN